MMIIDFKVTLGRDIDVEKTVPAKTIQHVIEKRHAGLDRRFSCAVDIQREFYIGLFGFSLDFRGPCHPDLLEFAPLGALPNPLAINLL
jgi:hypothetical protein